MWHVRRLALARLDCAFALALLGVALAELLLQSSAGPLAPQVVGVTVGSLAFAVRRREPFWTVIVFSGATVFVAAASEPPELLSLGLAAIFVAFIAGTIVDGRRLLIAAGTLSVAAFVRDLDSADLNWFDLLLDQVYLLMGLATGLVVRRRQRTVEHVASTASDMARDAVREERARIARELHDVIAHGVSVMVVQADAAREGTIDPQARVAFRTIEDAGRGSLREMRRLLGLLREDDGESPGLEPQPGIADLPALAESVRRAGLPVDLQTEGQPLALAAGIDLAAYRIVQEALTNTVRHAGPARATVRVIFDYREITLEITDTGRANGKPTAGSGRGLIGMRERARLYGGTVVAQAGDQGFRVSAKLPLDPADHP